MFFFIFFWREEVSRSSSCKPHQSAKDKPWFVSVEWAQSGKSGTSEIIHSEPR